jgi:hypothetical protein
VSQLIAVQLRDGGEDEEGEEMMVLMMCEEEEGRRTWRRTRGADEDGEG